MDISDELDAYSQLLQDDVWWQRFGPISKGLDTFV